MRVRGQGRNIRPSWAMALGIAAILVSAAQLSAAATESLHLHVGGMMKSRSGAT